MTKTKQRTRKGGFDGRIAALKQALQRTADPGYEIAKFRNRCSAGDLLDYAHKLFALREYRSYVVGNPFPKSLHDLLKNARRRWALDADHELLWTACQVRLFQREINAFLSMQDELSRSVLKGDYTAAKAILSAVRQEFGQSMWLLENEIAVRELAEGLEGNKAFVQPIIQDTAIDDNLRLFAYYSSFRAERAVSPDRYQAGLRSGIPGITDLEDSLGQFFAFRLNFFGSTRFHNAKAILVFDRDASIVDRYLTLLRMCQLAVADAELRPLRKPVEQVIKLLNGNIIDDRLRNLAQLLSLSRNPPAPGAQKKLLGILDLYTSGRYAECISGGIELISNGEVSFEYYEIVAKAAARQQDWPTNFQGLASTQSRILQMLRDVTIKNEKSAESYQGLLKLVFIFQSLPWAARMFAYLMREYRHESFKLPQRYSIFGETNAVPFNPRLGRFLDPTSRRQFFADIEVPSITAGLMQAAFDRDLEAIRKFDTAGIPESRIAKYVGQAAAATGDLNLAEAMYQRLATSIDPVDFQDGVDALARIWLDSGRINDAANLIVDVYLRNPRVRPRLPVEETLDRLDKLTPDIPMEVRANISIPTLFDIYSRTVSPDRDVSRALAYEDFLNANGVKRPSQLKPHLLAFEAERLKYFLRFLCVFQVMDTSVEFEGTEDIENERIAICQLLAEIDPINSEVYSEEIKEITQRLIINKGMRAVERSKIYVDVDGIKAAGEKGFRETFARYQNYLSAESLKETNEQLVLELHRLLEGTNLRVVLPLSQRYEVFKELFLQVRNAFVSSNEHGLDGYLSVGIRHGTLAGQLRSPLESQRLITQRDHTGMYKENQYWHHRLEGNEWSAARIKTAMSRLAQFSKDIDQKIDDIRNRDLQIKTEDRNKSGLFDFTMTNSELRSIQNSVGSQTTYEQAIDLIFSKLWEITDKNLTHVRSRFSSDYKTAFSRLCNDLQQDLRTIADTENLSGLDDAIAKARTLIFEELDKIAAWFTRTSDADVMDYDIGLPIDIAVQWVNNINPTRPLSLIRHIHSDQRCRGHTLKSVVNLFYILFDNVVQHSEVVEQPSLELTCDGKDRSFRMTLRNAVGANVDVQSERAKLKRLHADIKARGSMDLVRREGGSGLHKAAKILDVDLRCRSDLRFYYDDQRHFVVELSMAGGALFA
jgi:hypothetical protein